MMACKGRRVIFVGHCLGCRMSGKLLFGSWANAWGLFLRSKTYIKGEIEDENTDRSTRAVHLVD